MSEIKVAVARPLPDEEALWRGDTQAVQADVDDFGLANKRRDASEEREPAACRRAACADGAGADAGRGRAGRGALTEPPG